MANSLISTRVVDDQLSDVESSCSSITVPDSSRSWMSTLSLSRRSSFSTTTTEQNCSTNNYQYQQSHQKPHKANQAAWEAIKRLQREKGRIGLEHFRLLRRVGSGDIGNVYLCQIRNPIVGSAPCFYAMKVVDREALAIRKKLMRADMEKEILGMLDHPFLPTLYAHFDASHYSCLVMEYCTGGDLYVSRLRQPSKRFTISAAKFYAAETLLALEYLHMMGIVYRDLKPENVLVREDGHIMLSDFDLSLKCEVVPKLLKQKKLPSSSSSSSSITTDQREDYKNNIKGCSSSTSSSNCVIAPIQPVLSCFSLYSFNSTSARKKRSATVTTTITEHVDGSVHRNNDDHKDNIDDHEDGDDQYRHHHNQETDDQTELVAEPINARSKSFVGTHEYLAPEVISGLGHGSAVDWWTFGVFLYEMIYGKTPFKGENNEKTLVNILKQPLSFPRISTSSITSAKEYEEMVRVQDLITMLLVKNPKKRIGSLKGSVEIKRHDFFKGVNWALIRSVKPPMVPTDQITRLRNAATSTNHHHHSNKVMKGVPASAAVILPKVPLSKKERDEPYQIPHHFDYF